MSCSNMINDNSGGLCHVEIHYSQFLELKEELGPIEFQTPFTSSLLRHWLGKKFCNCYSKNTVFAITCITLVNSCIYSL